MLYRSIEMPARTYPSFGTCIFCGTSDDLTDEHVVPEALTGIGSVVISKGSCRRCNNYANEQYEQAALKNDFLPVRHMLALRRKKRGKRATATLIPGYCLDRGIPMETASESDFSIALDPGRCPPIVHFMEHPPAGYLLGQDKSGGCTSIGLALLHLGKPPRDGTPNSFKSRQPMRIGSPEMLVAKMAYCYAVSERGLEPDRYEGLRELLTGKRADVFNFVGSPIVREKLANRYLHAMYFRKRHAFETVLVHLFASFGGPVYEVVLSPNR